MQDTYCQLVAQGGPTEDTHGKSTLEQAGDTAAEALHAFTDSLKDSSKTPQQRTAGSAAPPAQRAAGDYDKAASGGATGRPGAYIASLYVLNSVFQPVYSSSLTQTHLARTPELNQACS